jgi:hypothetical protein
MALIPVQSLELSLEKARGSAPNSRLEMMVLERMTE